MLFEVCDFSGKTFGRPLSLGIRTTFRVVMNCLRISRLKKTKLYLIKKYTWIYNWLVDIRTTSSRTSRSGKDPLHRIDRSQLQSCLVAWESEGRGRKDLDLVINQPIIITPSS